MHVIYLHQPGEASRRVHGISEIAAGDAPTYHGILRTPIPRQVLRRRMYFGGAVGKAQRRRHQLQLPILGGVSSILRQRRLQLCL